MGFSVTEIRAGKQNSEGDRFRKQNYSYRSKNQLKILEFLQNQGCIELYPESGDQDGVDCHGVQCD